MPVLVMAVLACPQRLRLGVVDEALGLVTEIGIEEYFRMKIRMKTLSVAMGAALGLSAVNAQADALLFPFFQSGNGTFTFLSLQSLTGDSAFSFPGDGAGTGFGSNTLHYVFNYDDPVLEECTHFDVDGSMSAFDLMQQTVTRPGDPGGLNLPTLFGDSSTPGYLTVGDTKGFMTVSDESPEAFFTGQAIVLNVNSGIVAAYKGLNDFTSTSEDDFSFIVTSQLLHAMSWYPTNAVDTRWFTLVTGVGMANPAGWNGQRTFVSVGTGLQAGVWDRDENFLSGAVPYDVTCYETVTRNHFMNAAQLAGTVDGGWSIMVNLDPAVAGGFTGLNPAVSNGATGALAVKIETKVHPALAGSATAISLENALPNLPY